MQRIAIRDPLLEKRFGGVPQVELGIELTAKPFNVEQGFLQQYQLRLHLHIELARGAEQRDQHVTKGYVGQRPFKHRLAEGSQR